ncbi:hypothetical protein D3C87_2099030 [compost metagenome]
MNIYRYEFRSAPIQPPGIDRLESIELIFLVDLHSYCLNFNDISFNLRNSVGMSGFA